jgi:PAS domain S-box-containing protein
MKVLVADDSQPIRRRLVERLLRLPDVTVTEAEDTTDALRRIESFKPDVAVLDVRMPGGGGIKALDEIKAAHPGITVIIMTNYPYAQYRRKCLESGADFFFDKSTEFEQVAATVQELMDSSPEAVARRTAAAQLVDAKEALEKMEQRQRDISLLSMFRENSDPAALKEAHAMWERTFDAIPDMVSLFDADHRIIRVNKAMADRLGLPVAELTGKKCFTYIHGTCCPPAYCPHEAMLKDGQGHAIEIYEPYLKCWLNVSVTPVREDDRLIGAIHIARDITESKKTAELIKESEERYRRLFESMQAGFALHEIICYDGGVPCDYRFLEVNPAFEELTGLKAAELIGNTVKDVMPATEPAWIETYGKVALTGEAVRIDDFSGVLGRHYSVSAYSPRKGQFATVFTDITAQKNAEAAIINARDVAEGANKAKTQMLANMSHELRTPLNAIIGFSELLKGSSLDTDQRDYVETIESSGEALLLLISDLLDFSKIEMGKMVIRAEPFSVREVINRVFSQLSGVAANKGVELICTVNPALPGQSVGDPVRLQQVLVNLIGNALKFTDKGFVKLTVDDQLVPSGSRRIQFAVEDSGEGMSEATLGKIFKPFEQGDGSSTRVHGGTGLGLAISKELVDRMGGNIRVTSRPGEGSVFTFDILDRALPESPVSAEAVLADWSGRRICVWDDHPADLRAIEHLLERCGAIPRYAATVEDLNSCLKNESPSAVLCGLEQHQLAEHLPALRQAGPAVPWIAVSGWDSLPDDQVKDYFSAFIDRPLRPDQLYGALFRLTDRLPRIA